MQRFRAVRTLQKFAAAPASIHNHFNHDRHLNRRDIFKPRLVEFRGDLPKSTTGKVLKRAV
jgi:putative transposase